MRIARALALAGVASRRKCETYITAGEVAVNGEVLHDLGRQVDPAKDRVTFRGKALSLQPEPIYFLLHKPAGYTTTASDPYAMRTVYHLLPQLPARVFAVGRLDRESTGLLLFTNDGDLAQRLTHPRYEVGKQYEVELDRPLEGKDKVQLMKGVRLEEGIARVESIQPVSGRQLRLLIREGKKREIRRIFQEVGYRVTALTRVALGPLKLGNLPSGQGRALSGAEVAALKRATSLPV